MLPSHRTLLTALITTLSHPPASDSLNRRKLLLTLHVIFPRILLPALDLLDRNLITEYTTRPQNIPLDNKTPHSNSPSTFPKAKTPQATPRIHLVRSLASTLKRKESNTYLIHLDAWSCSCSGFILEAFSGTGDGDTLTPADSNWSFGGLSGEKVGVAGERLPCCKHLLACLLADRWEAFGEYVTKKECTINEMAGLVAGI